MNMSDALFRKYIGLVAVLAVAPACDPKESCVGDCAPASGTTGVDSSATDPEGMTASSQGSVSATSGGGVDTDWTTGATVTTASPSTGWTTGWDTDGGSATDGIGETEGLNCGDTYELPQLADARVVPASDIVDPPVVLEPDGYVLILSSQLGICDDPMGGFSCSEPQEYRLYLSLPADVMEDPAQQNPLEFGDATDTTGGIPDIDISSWIQIGDTPQCTELTTPPELGFLYVEAFDTETLQLQGRICNYYFTPELGYGLSGTFSTAPGC